MSETTQIEVTEEQLVSEVDVLDVMGETERDITFKTQNTEFVDVSYDYHTQTHNAWYYIPDEIVRRF